MPSSLKGIMLWTVELEGGPQRVNHAAVAVGDRIYSFGGYCTGENYRTIRNMDVHVLNTVTYRWKAIDIKQEREFVPFQRYGHTAVAFGHLVYVWGGRNDVSACNILYCFDTNTHEWSVPKVHGHVPEARDGHSACIINDHMYIFSGYLEYVESYTQDVHTLNLRTMTWSYIKATGPAPVYRDFHTATGVDGIMYVWGGREVASGWYDSPEHEEYGADLYALDTVTNRWSIIPCSGMIPIGRRSHSAFVYKGQIYVFGGFNSRKCLHFNDLHRFDPVLHVWEGVKPLGQGPCPRRRQSCCVVGSKMFLFGGTSPKENYDEIPEEDPNGEEQTDRRLKDHNDLHVLDFEPSLKTLCLLEVQKLKLEIAWLPRELQMLLKFMQMPNNITRPLNHTG
ncbi:kelch domain-containing protein 3-like isoform X1 [Penaeus chinensis]|uniref:kelch domain-containing protein 3-like isoform X1 n=2 Tax=Penaeus chinensis TaxID=139456 RepID=UPI001FB83A1F|nr:kelch domain-containing protein 3-like isoform X1 [Penaeus chinensis]